LRKIQEEMKSEAELKLQKKNQLAEEFKIQLASQIKEKEEGRQRLERIAQTLDEQNTRFNDMKAMFADRRKAFTNSTIQ
jgi:thioesterase domain-containing protein